MSLLLLWHLQKSIGRTAILALFLLGSVLQLPLSLAAIDSGASSEKLASVAKVKDCGSLVQELKNMRKAQAALLESMVKKNDSMAETLDLYADRFRSHSGMVDRSEIAGIKKSAESFRKHSLREDQIVQRFGAEVDGLVSRLEGCLSSASLAKK